jgi:hypothetical protein
MGSLLQLLAERWIIIGGSLESVVERTISGLVEREKTPYCWRKKVSKWGFVVPKTRCGELS